MADYWISNPRKFCEICKCWFGDNQASISFHEQGKRHKENVKRQLKDARIKSGENEKQKIKNAQTLAAIEQAALKAYHKDIESKYGGLPCTQTQEPLTEAQIHQRKHEEIAATLQAQKKREIEKTSIEENIQKKVKELKQESSGADTGSSWQQLVSPEGHTYYYNMFTHISQWEVPQDFQPVQVEPTTTSEITNEGSSVCQYDDNNDIVLVGQKRAAKSADFTDIHSATKKGRTSGPYGSWTTIALCEQQEQDTDITSNIECEASKKDSKRNVIKFEEKAMPTEGSSTYEDVSITQGNTGFKTFSFKKRAGARPKVRQRTSELS